MVTRFSFLLSCITSIILLISGENITCTKNNVSYVCKNVDSEADYPVTLPENIRKVTLYGTFKLNYFPNERFNRPTWTNVSELSILEFSEAQYLKKNFLFGLGNLKLLAISSCTEFREIDKDVFNSTPDLEALYLDRNPYLKMLEIEAALTDKLDKLKYLSLIGLGAIARNVVLGVNFSKALSKKNLTYLDISDVVTIIIEHPSVGEIFMKLKYLNISFSAIITTNNINLQNYSYYRNLEFIDLIGCKSHEQYGVPLTDVAINWVLFENMQYLFAQNVTDPSLRLILSATYQFENDMLGKVKVVDLSNNNIIIFNITFLGRYDFSGLETMNISNNNLEYISASSMSFFPCLKILDLSRNQLHKMQNTDGFTNLFSKSKDLEIIVLRNNHIRDVPLNLFSSNTKLRVIDISENQLSYFNIDLHNVQYLTLIDLKNNRLKSLSASFYGQLDQMFIHKGTLDKQNTLKWKSVLSNIMDKHIIAEKYRYGYNESDNIGLNEGMSTIPQYLTLNVLENPLICDCDTLDFIKWLLVSNIGIVNKPKLECKFDGHKTLMDNPVIELVNSKCRFVRIISIALSSSVVFAVGIFALIIRIYYSRRKARQNQDLKNLRREILDDKTHFNYVVFLSYCSRDSTIVDDIILPKLRTFFREKFKTQRDLVSTGSDNFVPGLHIIDEIHRCIDESLVIVPVITPAFLESPWSLRECVDAIENDKQVVVLMKQHTDTSRTTDAVRHLIEKYTRATWSYNEDLFDTRPTWNTICDAIIQIAIKSFLNYRNQHSQHAIELVPLVE